MGKVNLKDNYFIRVDNDDKNYTLMRTDRASYKRGKKPTSGILKETTDKVLGYYSTLGDAVMGFRKFAIKNKLSVMDVDLAGAIKAISEADESIRQMVRDNGLEVKWM